MSIQQYRPASFNILPVMVKNILIINTILWLAEEVFQKQLGFSFNERFGLYYPLSPLFNPIQFVSHLFLHGGFMHLLSNMFALWMFGTVLENLWGPKRFLTYYMITGLGAALIHTFSGWYGIHELAGEISAYATAPNFQDFYKLMEKNAMYLGSEGVSTVNVFMNNWQQNPGSTEYARESVEWAENLLTYKMNVPTVGASGAVFGILLAYGMLFPNTVILLYFAIPIKAKYFVTLYGLFELYLGFANNPADNVAHFAHLGGMLFGFILIKFWNRRNRRQFY
jgi:membrane associated rhomboid family serine protease